MVSAAETDDKISLDLCWHLLVKPSMNYLEWVDKKARHILGIRILELWHRQQIAHKKESRRLTTQPHSILPLVQILRPSTLRHPALAIRPHHEHITSADILLDPAPPPPDVPARHPVQALRPARIVGEIGAVVRAGGVRGAQDQDRPVVARVLPAEGEPRRDGVVVYLEPVRKGKGRKR